MTKSSLQTKEYIAIDFFRLIAAILVFAIHVVPFEDVNETLSFGVSQGLCRIAVPFFFITSGYFLNSKLKSKNAVFSYTKRIFKLYIIYTVISLPQIVNAFIKADGSILTRIMTLLRDFVFVGSYGQLWYFVALIAAAWILYLLSNVAKLSDKLIFVLCIVLYCIGTLGSAYINALSENLFLAEIISAYKTLFGSTRNGLFFGLPLMFVGCLINKNLNPPPENREGRALCVGRYLQCANETVCDSVNKKVFS